MPTTSEPAEGVVRGILEAVERAGVDPRAVRAVLHGTTIATNTVLEGKGARVGLLVTKGFRYVLEIALLVDPRPHLRLDRLGQAAAARRRSGHW